MHDLFGIMKEPYLLIMIIYINLLIPQWDVINKFTSYVLWTVYFRICPYFFFRSPVIVKNKNYYWKINVILIEFSKNHLSDNQSIQIQYLALPYQTIFNQMPESLPKNTLGRKWIMCSYLDDKVCMYSVLTSSVFV